MSDYWRDLAVSMEREAALRREDSGMCSHGRPDHQELIRELREAVGLFAGAMPVTPKGAWEEAVGRVAELEALIRDIAAGDPRFRENDPVFEHCVLCANDRVHAETCLWRRARELTGDETP